MKKVEKTLYTVLGVTLFKKAVGFVCKAFNKINKKHNEDYFNVFTGLDKNYHIKDIKDYERLSETKSVVFYNGLINFLGLLATSIVCITNFGVLPLSITLVNLYSLMLHRYNVLEINEKLDEAKPLYNNYVSDLKSKLTMETNLLGKDKCLVIENSKKSEEKDIYSALSQMNLNELRQYKAYIENYKRKKIISNYANVNLDNYDFTFGESKKLKLISGR